MTTTHADEDSFPGWEVQDRIAQSLKDYPPGPSNAIRNLAILFGCLLIAVGLLGAATVRIGQGAQLGAEALTRQAVPVAAPSGPIPSVPATGVSPLTLGATYVDRDGAGRSTVTVLYARRVPHCYGYDKQGGYELLLIYVSVKGAVGHTFSNPFFWNFTTFQGQEVVQNLPNCDAEADAHKLPTTDKLLPGQEATGYLAFEVPEGYGGILTFTKVAEELASWNVPIG